MAPFYGWGSTASRLQLLRGGSLLFTIQFPEIPANMHPTDKWHYTKMIWYRHLKLLSMRQLLTYENTSGNTTKETKTGKWIVKLNK